MTPVLGALCFAAFMAAQLLSKRARYACAAEHCTTYRFAIAGFAYGFNAVFFYKQVWHYYTGCWMLAILVATFMLLIRERWQLLIAAAFLPGLFVTIRPLISQRAFTSVNAATNTPRGELLWLPSDTITRIQNLVAGLADVNPSDAKASMGRGVIIWCRGPVTGVVSGLYFFYLLPQAVRQSMIFPGWVRPRDLEQIEHAVSNGSPIILLQEPNEGRPPKDICQWRTSAFPKPFCRQISNMLADPITADGASWIFPSLRAGRPVLIDSP